MHSEIQIPPLPKSKLGSDVSGCHPLVCSVRARVSEEGSRCPRDVPSQDRERSEPRHGLRPSPAQLSVPMLWKGVFTTHHPRAAAELPLCLQRAKHTQPIVNNNITEFFHIPDSSQHPQRSLSCSSTAQSQRPVIASQPWVLPFHFHCPLRVPTTPFLTAPDPTNVKAGKKMENMFSINLCFHPQILTLPFSFNYCHSKMAPK